MSATGLTVKADASSLVVYDQHQEIVSYARCWQRGEVLGAERFQKELFAQMAAAQRSACPTTLSQMARPGLRTLPATLGRYDRSLARQVRELLELVREYGPETVAIACRKPMPPARSVPDYIGNILRQQQMQREVQPRLRLQDRN